MQQLFQDLRDGRVFLETIPAPCVKPGHLLIAARRSLVSLGTERMLMEFGKAGFINKARQQPEKVRQVLNKISTDGLLPTLNSVRNKLSEPLPLGYCSAGLVLEVGAGVRDFKSGDRVISNGPHASLVCVPEQLCAKIPDNVDDQSAAFCVLAAVALQGVRLASPTLGETVAVMGLGLLGVLTCQILRANGCNVIGFDVAPEKIALLKSLGFTAHDSSTEFDPVQVGKTYSAGLGVDAVIITASTKESSLISQAAGMCRKRGRIILVGAIGLELNRSDFYEKELTFQVSCSYGPGRYDANYEQRGLDYPIGFVRWTEQRNFEAVLGLMARGALDPKPLITATFPFAEAPQWYEHYVSAPGTMGLLIDYPAPEDFRRRLDLPISQPTPRHGVSQTRVRIGVIGAGGFAASSLLPAFRQTSAELCTIASRGGSASVRLARKFGFTASASHEEEVLNDPELNTVVILTRHDSHARLVINALKSGKHVFVEKPLALSLPELNAVAEAMAAFPNQHVMVGFNRRFAPLTQKIVELLKGRQSAVCMNMLVNAGAIPGQAWQQAGEQGGRILGEACHFIDLMSFIAGAAVTRVFASQIGKSSDGICEDKVAIQLEFADGSIGTLQYLANGSPKFPKETMQIFCDGKILAMDNFRSLTGFGFKNFSKLKLGSQDKGHRSEVKSFVDAIASGAACSINPQELINVSGACLAVLDSLKCGQPILLSSENSHSNHESSSMRCAGNK